MRKRIGRESNVHCHPNPAVRSILTPILGWRYPVSVEKSFRESSSQNDRASVDNSRKEAEALNHLDRALLLSEHLDGEVFCMRL